MWEIGIWRRDIAGCVERRHLPGGQRASHGAEVLAQLLFVLCADDDRADCRPLNEPIQSDLRHAFTVSFAIASSPRSGKSVRYWRPALLIPPTPNRFARYRLVLCRNPARGRVLPESLPEQKREPAPQARRTAGSS